VTKNEKPPRQTRSGSRHSPRATHGYYIDRGRNGAAGGSAGRALARCTRRARPRAILSTAPRSRTRLRLGGPNSRHFHVDRKHRCSGAPEECDGMYRPYGVRASHTAIPTAYAVGSGAFAPPALRKNAMPTRSRGTTTRGVRRGFVTVPHAPAADPLGRNEQRFGSAGHSEARGAFRVRGPF